MAQIPTDAKLYIALANGQGTLTEAESGTSSALDGDDYLGPIYTDTGTTYEEINKVLSTNIGDPSDLEEAFTTIGDAYERYLYIKDDGSFSFDIFEFIDSDGSIVDAHNLIWAGLYLPHGATNTASEDADYDPITDPGVLTEGTNYISSGNPGYNFCFESELEDDKYHQWLFYGCSLKYTPSIEPQKGNKGSIEVYGVRHRDEVRSANTSISG